MQIVQEFVRSEVQPSVEVQVVSVSRMGAYSEQRQGSHKLRVEFASNVQARAVLRATFHLKTYNQTRKAEGHRVVGLETF